MGGSARSDAGGGVSRPVVLVGMPGAGKSTVGPLLARMLGLPFRDSDALVEQEAGLGISQIFRRHGEQWFREKESRVVADLLRGPAAIVALGGGAILTAETAALAARHSTIFWLDAELAVLERRLKGGGRPLLAGDATKRLALMKGARDPCYARAGVRIDANAEPERVAEAIASSLCGSSAG